MNHCTLISVPPIRRKRHARTSAVTLVLFALLAQPAIVHATPTSPNLDSDFWLKTFALALASSAPSPLNVIGTQLVGASFGTSLDNSLEQEMNAKIDTILGELSDMHATLASLRADIAADFEAAFIARDQSTIDATINHVLITIEDEYNNYKYAGFDSDTLFEELAPLSDLLAESLNWYMFDSALSPNEKLSTAAKFIAMAELHLMILQEQISLFTSANYRCDTAPCNPRLQYLEASINTYYDKIDRYVGFLEQVARAATAARLDQVTKSIESEAVWETQCYIIITTPHCYSYVSYTRHRHTVFDGGTNQTVESFTTIDTRDEDRLKRAKADYLAGLKRQVRDSIHRDIGAIIQNLEYSKVQYQSVDGVIAQGCVAFYASVAFAGLETIFCEDGSQRTLGALNSTFSSYKMGQGVSLSVFASPNCASEEILLTEESVSDMSNFVASLPATGSFDVQMNANDSISSLALTSSENDRLIAMTFDGATIKSPTPVQDLGRIDNINACASDNFYHFSDAVTTNGSNPGVLRSNLQAAQAGPAAAFLEITYVEDQSWDQEQQHVPEDVDVLVFDNVLDGMDFIEAGTIELDHQQVRVDLVNTYVDPVIILDVTTIRGTQPVGPVITKVRANSFDVELREFASYDNTHVVESLNYLVIEAGTYHLGDGQVLIADTERVSTTFQGTPLSTVRTKAIDLSEYSMVTQMQSVDSHEVVTAQVSSKRVEEFDIRLIVEEAALQSGQTMTAEVGYIAVGSR